MAGRSRAAMVVPATTLNAVRTAIKMATAEAAGGALSPGQASKLLSAVEIRSMAAAQRAWRDEFPDADAVVDVAEALAASGLRLLRPRADADLHAGHAAGGAGGAAPVDAKKVAERVVVLLRTVAAFEGAIDGDAVVPGAGSSATVASACLLLRLPSLERVMRDAAYEYLTSDDVGLPDSPELRTLVEDKVRVTVAGGGKGKGKRKGKGRGGKKSARPFSLREQPYSLRDGDLLAVMDGKEDPDGVDNWMRIEDFCAIRNEEMRKARVRAERAGGGGAKARPSRAEAVFRIYLEDYSDGDEGSGDDRSSSDEGGD
mmetsp:Transcript_17797/g.62788  ORF Transcript_17797/g.62788 Transcript_17797/m.62788 type:complete len:315 (-) Transcript_17797:60-1004(-)